MSYFEVQMKKIELRRQFRETEQTFFKLRIADPTQKRKVRPKKEQKKTTYGLLLKQTLDLTISVTFKMFQRGKILSYFFPCPIIHHITGAVVESLIKDSPIMRHNAQCPQRPDAFIKDLRIQSVYSGLPIKKYTAFDRRICYATSIIVFYMSRNVHN